LITSSSEVISVVAKAKTLAAKEKAGKFKSQRKRDQLSAALENKEHRGRTRVISSIASWKEWFVDESHLYKKRKTQDIEHNTEEIFKQQFFNFMKNPTICCADAYSKNQFGSRCHYPTLCSSSASSAPNRDEGKYHMDDIKDPTPCTLMYVKGMTSRAIEVAEATVMPSRILHGWATPA
jgi:hypothetical protein